MHMVQKLHSHNSGIGVVYLLDGLLDVVMSQHDTTRTSFEGQFCWVIFDVTM